MLAVERRIQSGARLFSNFELVSYGRARCKLAGEGASTAMVPDMATVPSDVLGADRSETSGCRARSTVAPVVILIRVSFGLTKLFSVHVRNPLLHSSLGVRSQSTAEHTQVSSLLGSNDNN